MTDRTNNNESTSRRDFLKTSTAAVVGGTVATNLSLSSSLYAAGNDEIRVGLIGCGGRGTGAAAQALTADPYTKLVAMADAFPDRLETSLDSLKKQSIGKQIAVDDDHKFVGFNAYKDLVDNVDVVLMATPPHFRPAHLRYAVEQGKHCFVEKPVAVDAPGVRSVLESCAMAKEKNLSVVSGLCWRYHYTIRETMDHVHNGTLGDLTTIQASYNTGGVWEPRKTVYDVLSKMEYQMRNWYYYTWLSGDFNVEQHVHSLDKVAWAMKDETPVKATGFGGRQQRTDPKYGNIFDHFAIVYEYANGVKAFCRCRHQKGCANEVTDHIMGTKGTAHISGSRTRIEGETKWAYKGPSCNMYQVEHDEFFASIRAGNPINNGDYMSKSTMLAIMGRMVGYTGQSLTWEQVMNSKLDLTPKAYEFGDIETPEVAIPGVTQFV